MPNIDRQHDVCGRPFLRKIFNLAREGVAAYSLARGVPATVTRESVEAEACLWQSLGPRKKTSKLLLSAKQKQKLSAGLA